MDRLTWLHWALRDALSGAPRAWVRSGMAGFGLGNRRYSKETVLLSLLEAPLPYLARPMDRPTWLHWALRDPLSGAPRAWVRLRMAGFGLGNCREAPLPYLARPMNRPTWLHWALRDALSGAAP